MTPLFFFFYLPSESSVSLFLSKKELLNSHTLFLNITIIVIFVRRNVEFYFLGSIFLNVSTSFTTAFFFFFPRIKPRQNIQFCINYNIVMSTNLPLLHTASPIKNKSFKFQRTGSPVYRLSRSSSSDTDSLSKFYVKISGHFSEDKAICGTLQTRLSKRDILVGKCSIKAKRLKFANNQKEQIKVKKKLTLENPPPKDTHIMTREEDIRQIEAQNQELKRKQQLLQQTIENLKLQIQHKNTQIEVLEIEARHSPATLSSPHPDSPFLKPRDFTQPSQYSQKYTDHPQILKRVNFQENTFDGTGSTELSITRPQSSFDFGNFSQCSRSLSTEVQQAQQEISRLQVVHNFELRKLNKEFEYYKKNKEKEMKMLKDKFNQLLNKFKEVSKKAASLEIQCIIDKKSKGKTQSQSLAECIKDFEEFYALSSDEEK